MIYIPIDHPSGRRTTTSKIVPDNFLPSVAGRFYCSMLMAASMAADLSLIHIYLLEIQQPLSLGH